MIITGLRSDLELRSDIERPAIMAGLSSRYAVRSLPDQSSAGTSERAPAMGKFYLFIIAISIAILLATSAYIISL